MHCGKKSSTKRLNVRRLWCRCVHSPNSIGVENFRCARWDEEIFQAHVSHNGPRCYSVNVIQPWSIRIGHNVKNSNNAHTKCNEPLEKMVEKRTEEKENRVDYYFYTVVRRDKNIREYAIKWCVQLNPEMQMTRYHARHDIIITAYMVTETSLHLQLCQWWQHMRKAAGKKCVRSPLKLVVCR